MLIANVAIPTIVPHMIVAVILLPVIAAIEAIVIHRDITQQYQPAFRLALGANWRSTVIGLPLGYLLAIAGIVPAGMFSSLIPDASRELFNTTLFHTLAMGGMIPNDSIPVAMAIGLVIVLIPYFLVSVIIEKRYLIRLLPDADRTQVRNTTWKMNIVTYSCLFTYGVINLISVANR